MCDVFISYARRSSRAWVASFAEDLESNNITAWYDKEISSTSKDWRLEIDTAIEKSEMLILILTPASSQSPYVTYEWTYALALGKPIIILERELVPTGGIHPRLMTAQKITHTDADGNLGDVLNIIKKEINKIKSAKKINLVGNSNSVEKINDLHDLLVEFRLSDKLAEEDILLFASRHILSLDDVRQINEHVQMLGNS